MDNLDTVGRRYELHRGDCLDVLAEAPDASVDAIITDPPYGTTACDWDSVIPFGPMWEQLKRIIKLRGAIVLFGSQPFTSALIMSNAGWFSHEWIWQKSNGGGFLNANRLPLKRHESVCVFADGWPKTYNPQMTSGSPYTSIRAGVGATTKDVSVIGYTTKNKGERYPTSTLVFPNETGLHPTQKPVPLLEYLIKTYTNEGETVLDFTMGSGSTGVACAKTKRNFIGVELDAEYFETAKKRIEFAYDGYFEQDNPVDKPVQSLLFAPSAGCEL